mmetsp:Transcript_44143/g.99525  ORF Transcript_44143/g.99525 Transcript_44143/m.99525 type:complete len:528 (-) Transcript_44143:1277-2860(-)
MVLQKSSGSLDELQIRDSSDCLRRWIDAPGRRRHWSGYLRRPRCFRRQTVPTLGSGSGNPRRQYLDIAVLQMLGVNPLPAKMSGSSRSAVQRGSNPCDGTFDNNSPIIDYGHLLLFLSSTIIGGPAGWYHGHVRLWVHKKGNRWQRGRQHLLHRQRLCKRSDQRHGEECPVLRRIVKGNNRRQSTHEPVMPATLSSNTRTWLCHLPGSPQDCCCLNLRLAGRVQYANSGLPGQCSQVRSHNVTLQKLHIRIQSGAAEVPIFNNSSRRRRSSAPLSRQADECKFLCFTGSRFHTHHALAERFKDQTTLLLLARPGLERGLSWSYDSLHNAHFRGRHGGKPCCMAGCSSGFHIIQHGSSRLPKFIEYLSEVGPYQRCLRPCGRQVRNDHVFPHGQIRDTWTTILDVLRILCNVLVVILVLLVVLRVTSKLFLRLRPAYHILRGDHLLHSSLHRLQLRSGLLGDPGLLKSARSRLLTLLLRLELRLQRLRNAMVSRSLNIVCSTSCSLRLCLCPLHRPCSLTLCLLRKPR